VAGPQDGSAQREGAGRMGNMVIVVTEEAGQDLIVQSMNFVDLAIYSSIQASLLSLSLSGMVPAIQPWEIVVPSIEPMM
jgi:hypothetical protein